MHSSVKVFREKSDRFWRSLTGFYTFVRLSSELSRASFASAYIVEFFHILTMVEFFCLQKFLQVSAEQEYRRGGSYKVGLKAAGGSHVNAHSLTPTLPVRYSGASPYTAAYLIIVICNAS